MNDRRALTELEGTVLGVVWARQPCTTYQVRREFIESPSPYWSGSAGAIYPLMARLAAAGLVASEAHATGARKSRMYRLTPAGRRRLCRWVGPPVTAAVAAVPPDPMRVRLAFVGVLPPAQRRRLLRELEAGLAEFLAVARSALSARRGIDPEFALMGRGAIAMQKARLAWLDGIIQAETRAARSRGAPPYGVGKPKR